MKVSARVLLPAYGTWEQNRISISIIEKHQMQGFNGIQFFIHAMTNG